MLVAVERNGPVRSAQVANDSIACLSSVIARFVDKRAHLRTDELHAYIRGAEGRILGQSQGNNTHSMQTNFRTSMDPEVLRQGYRKILAHRYDLRLKNYFARCFKYFLRALRHLLYRYSFGSC